MKYLFEAPDEAMVRWKEAAVQERLPFAEWLRRAAELALSSPVPLAQKPAYIAASTEKRSYIPDPKVRKR